MVDDAYSGRAISESSYERKVQRIAGSWRGGARFTVRAKPRTEKLKFYVAHLTLDLSPFAGQWIVIQDGAVIEHGPDLDKIARKARVRGVQRPRVLFVELRSRTR